MRRKNKGAAILAMIMAVSMAGTSAVYAEETVPAKTVNIGEEKTESEDNEPAPCREDGHELTEFKVIPPTCTEKGYSIYKCKTDGCGYEERRDETAPLGHDMKEVSIQAATADKPGVITYKCQRTGCDYTELSEIPYKDSEKDGDIHLSQSMIRIRDQRQILQKMERTKNQMNLIQKRIQVQKTILRLKTRTALRQMKVLQRIQKIFQTKILMKNMRHMHLLPLQIL